MQCVSNCACPEQLCGPSGEAGGGRSQRTEDDSAWEVLQAL